ncbi:hypothetical protein HGM15179_004825, partial [Zosterops borbonicus]
VGEMHIYTGEGEAATTTSNMKMAKCIALLGLVILGCFSDLAVAQRRANCASYMTTGKTFNMVCPRNYSPVCGTNGRTYSNECSLCKDFIRNRALDKKHDGRCVRIDCTGFLRPGSGFSIPCGMDYSPICGTNGITYRNKCQFCTAVQNTNTQFDCSQQKGSQLICTSEFNPVCGSDGRTYGNKCQFCNAFTRSAGNLFVRHQGQC